MFDGQKRLLVCNKSFADLYALPRQLTERGTPLLQILEHRIGNGSHASTQERYIEDRLKSVDASGRHTEIIYQNDGRAIQIQFFPLTCGGWVALHEDVTEQTEK